MKAQAETINFACVFYFAIICKQLYIKFTNQASVYGNYRIRLRLLYDIIAGNPKMFRIIFNVHVNKHHLYLPKIFKIRTIN